MLLRAALVIVFVRDGRDDAGLVVIPADGRDASERTELRARAVGGDRAGVRAARGRLRSPSSATRLPGAQWTTDAVTR